MYGPLQESVTFLKRSQRLMRAWIVSASSAGLQFIRKSVTLLKELSILIYGVTRDGFIWFRKSLSAIIEYIITVIIYLSAITSPIWLAATPKFFNIELIPSLLYYPVLIIWATIILLFSLMSGVLIYFLCKAFWLRSSNVGGQVDEGVWGRVIPRIADFLSWVVIIFLSIILTISRIWIVGFNILDWFAELFGKWQ